MYLGLEVMLGQIYNFPINRGIFSTGAPVQYQNDKRPTSQMYFGQIYDFSIYIDKSSFVRYMTWNLAK